MANQPNISGKKSKSPTETRPETHPNPSRGREFEMLQAPSLWKGWGGFQVGLLGVFAFYFLYQSIACVASFAQALKSGYFAVMA